MRVKRLLLVNNILNLVEERGIEIFFMFGEGNKHCHSFLEIQIAIDILLVKLFHNKLFQFWTRYVP